MFVDVCHIELIADSVLVWAGETVVLDFLRTTEKKNS